MTATQTERSHELITRGRNLLDNLENYVDRDTWETAPEVFAAWQAGADDVGVHTNNLAIYRTSQNPHQVLLNLFGREYGNMFLEDAFRKEMYDGIVGTDFFQPQGEMLNRIKSAIRKYQSIEIDYSGLNLVDENSHNLYGHVLVSGHNTAMERKLISAVYGTKNPGNGKMIYLPKQKVIDEQLKANLQGVIVRACYFHYDQNFNASDRDIDGPESRVRGVRRSVVAKGDETQKIEPVIVEPKFLSAYQGIVIGKSVIETPHGTYVRTGEPVTTTR